MPLRRYFAGAVYIELAAYELSRRDMLEMCSFLQYFSCVDVFVPPSCYVVLICLQAVSSVQFYPCGAQLLKITSGENWPKIGDNEHKLKDKLAIYYMLLQVSAFSGFVLAVVHMSAKVMFYYSKIMQ